MQLVRDPRHQTDLVLIKNLLSVHVSPVQGIVSLPSPPPSVDLSMSDSGSVDCDDNRGRLSGWVPPGPKSTKSLRVSGRKVHFELLKFYRYWLSFQIWCGASGLSRPSVQVRVPRGRTWETNPCMFRVPQFDVFHWPCTKSLLPKVVLDRHVDDRTSI